MHQGATRRRVDMPTANQLARVAVSPETWTAFRQAALAQGISIAAYLGRLVEREVRRRDDRPVAGLAPDASERDQALLALEEVRASIDELDRIAGRLARSAAMNGASWEGIGTSLRLGADQARRAYGQRG